MKGRGTGGTQGDACQPTHIAQELWANRGKRGGRREGGEDRAGGEATIVDPYTSERAKVGGRGTHMRAAAAAVLARGAAATTATATSPSMNRIADEGSSRLPQPVALASEVELDCTCCRCSPSVLLGTGTLSAGECWGVLGSAGASPEHPPMCSITGHCGHCRFLAEHFLPGGSHEVRLGLWSGLGRAGPGAELS